MHGKLTMSGRLHLITVTVFEMHSNKSENLPLALTAHDSAWTNPGAEYREAGGQLSTSDNQLTVLWKDALPQMFGEQDDGLEYSLPETWKADTSVHLSKGSE